jgi:hypothetical protein
VATSSATLKPVDATVPSSPEPLTATAGLVEPSADPLNTARDDPPTASTEPPPARQGEHSLDSSASVAVPSGSSEESENDQSQQEGGSARIMDWQSFLSHWGTVHGMMLEQKRDMDETEARCVAEQVET